LLVRDRCRGVAMTKLSGSHFKPSHTAPFIAAAPFEQTKSGRTVQLLSAGEIGRLAQIAAIVRFPKGARLYEEGEKADCVYNVIEGEVKMFSALPSGQYRIVAFLSAGDLLGLSENGRYVSSAQAITRVRAYRLPLTDLKKLLRSDPELEYSFLCKLCHELRVARFHTITLCRHDADGKLAMFLTELDSDHSVSKKSSAPIFLPMTRSDVAAYLGLSLEAVSRSFRKLQRDGVIRLNDRHNVEITDRARFDHIALPT